MKNYVIMGDSNGSEYDTRRFLRRFVLIPLAFCGFLLAADYTSDLVVISLGGLLRRESDELN